MMLFIRSLMTQKGGTKVIASVSISGARPRVFISQSMPQAGVEMLQEFCEVDYHNGTKLPMDEYLVRLKSADAAVVFMTDNIDEELLQQCPNLRLLSSFEKGYDNINIEACTKRGIVVAINPYDLTASTADLAMGLLLAACRNIPSADAHLRFDGFQGWHPYNCLGADFHQSNLGIIGFGAIGQAIAKRAKGFDVNISYNDIQRKPETEHDLGVSFKEIPRLLAESDFIVLAANLTMHNRHLLGPEEFAYVKSGSYLINIARGSLVNENALLGALRSGRLRGYASDVFEFEDLCFTNRPKYINLELLASTESTVFTPHLGTATVQARQKLAVATANQLLAVLRGETPPGVINGYCQ